MWLIVRTQVCIWNGRITYSSTGIARRDGWLRQPTWLSCASQEQTPLQCRGRFSCDASLLTHSWLCICRDSRTSPYHSAYEHGCSMRNHSLSSIHRRDKTPLWFGLPHQSMSCGIAAVPSLCVNPRAPSSTCNQSCWDHCRQCFGHWDEPQLP